MNGLHVERVGDELLVSIFDDEGRSTISLPIPEGVDDLIEAIRAEVES